MFRLGRVLKSEKGPGLVLIRWPIDKIVKVSLRVVPWDIPPQDVITRDNVSLKVNAVVYFRVTSATKAVIEVENFRYAVERAIAVTLRYLQTLIEIGAEQNTTIVFPLPLDLLGGLGKLGRST